MKNDTLARQSTDAFQQLNLPYGVGITDTSLDVPQTLDDEQMLALGTTLRRMENASKWWIADFIVFVQQMRGTRTRESIYDRVQKLWPDYARATLQTFASIARRVPAKIRSAHLSFDHHAHIATLFEEKQAAEMQVHYIKAAERSGATAEELRLMIADTRKGIAHDKPKRGRPTREEPIDVGGSAVDPVSQESRKPIERDPEPELMTGSHAQLASDAQRSLARLHEWYVGKARKGKASEWPDDRKEVLVRDLKPVLKEMHHIADIFAVLTNAEQTGDFA